MCFQNLLLHKESSHYLLRFSDPERWTPAKMKDRKAKKCCYYKHVHLHSIKIYLPLQNCKEPSHPPKESCNTIPSQTDLKKKNLILFSFLLEKVHFFNHSQHLNTSKWLQRDLSW